MFSHLWNGQNTYMDGITEEKECIYKCSKNTFSLPLLQHQIILEGIDNDTEHYQFQEIHRIYFLASYYLVRSHV